MENQICFLLSYIKYAENDAILHCFSKESGFQTFFVKGIYSAKNKKKAYLFPLNQVNVTINQRSNFSSKMPTATKIEKGNLFFDFEDVKINSILFFVADFLHQILKVETQSSKFYLEIEVFINELYKENYDAYIAFIFTILKFQGISPLISDGGFLDPESGIFSEVQEHLVFDEETSASWKNYLSAENGYEIKLNRRSRHKILQSLMLYYQIHFAGFYKPKSLAVIEQIFD